MLQQHLDRIQLMSIIGYSISLVSLTVAVGVLLQLRYRYVTITQFQASTYMYSMYIETPKLQKICENCGKILIRNHFITFWGRYFNAIPQTAIFRTHKDILVDFVL